LMICAGAGFGAKVGSAIGATGVFASGGTVGVVGNDVGVPRTVVGASVGWAASAGASEDGGEMSCDQTADAPGAINAIRRAVTPIANAFDATPTRFPKLGKEKVLRERSRSSIRRQTSRFRD